MARFFLFARALFFLFAGPRRDEQAKEHHWENESLHAHEDKQKYNADDRTDNETDPSDGQANGRYDDYEIPQQPKGEQDQVNGLHGSPGFHDALQPTQSILRGGPARSPSQPACLDAGLQ